MQMAGKQSLVSLTQGFVKIMTEANGADVDLGVIERVLNTTKRRLYDVVNVLAGIGLVARTGKSRVKWILNPSSSRKSGENSDREPELDALIVQVDSELIEISDSELFQRCGWIDAHDAGDCIRDDSISVYSLKGPPAMSIRITADEEIDGNNRILCCVENPSDGPIQFCPIRP